MYLKEFPLELGIGTGGSENYSDGVNRRIKKFLKQGYVRGQHFRGQGQWSSRPRPEVFEAKVKASDLCNDG